jgi:hypothetical protein
MPKLAANRPFPDVILSSEHVPERDVRRMATGGVDSARLMLRMLRAPEADCEHFALVYVIQITVMHDGRATLTKATAILSQGISARARHDGAEWLC